MNTCVNIYVTSHAVARSSIFHAETQTCTFCSALVYCIVVHCGAGLIIARFCNQDFVQYAKNNIGGERGDISGYPASRKKERDS